MRSSVSSSSFSRAQPSSPSFSLLFFATLLLLAFTSTSSLARPSRPHGTLGEHKSSLQRPQSLLSRSSSFTRPRSPRPTPEPVAGGLVRLMATWKTLPTLPLPDLIAKRATTCYTTGTTAAQINSYFASAGLDAGVLQLCPGAILSITETILFTKSNQGIQTQGGSAVALANRAQINIVDASLATAIQANGCINCHNLLIDSLIIDGGRVALGALSGGGGLIEVGGTMNNVTVTNTQIANTRGWTSLHIIEGNCYGAVIKNNVIGPSGTEDIIADGISLACVDSIVQGNTIFDATDGAIVVFNAPGSDISGNTITATNSVLLGGINMVDYNPYAGNYTGTKVYSNAIMATGAQIIIGIAQGPALWGDTITTRNYGGSVYSNTFGGTHMTFGLAVAGVTGWSTTNNIALSSARFQGNKTTGCHGIGAAVVPTFAVYDASKTSTLTRSQANCWVEGSMQYLLCYDPGASTTLTAPGSAFLVGGTCSAAAPTVPTTTSNWKNSGYCMLDADARILADDFLFSANNSVTLCTTRCTSLQYTYAGMENSNQCYCSNKIATDAGQGSLFAMSYCSSICPGDSSQMCGGNSYTMSLWYDASRISAPVLGASSSSSVASSTSSTFSSSTRASSTSSSTRASSSSSSAKSSSSSTISSTSASASASASALPSSNGYASLGCRQDVQSYILNGYAFNSAAMTIDLCTSTCQSKSYAYAGLEYSTQCRCSNTLTTSTGGGATLAASSCSMSCGGDSTSKCGGYYTMSLYYSSSSNGYASLGCVQDVGSYILNGYAFSSSAMTIGLCTSTCKSKSYAYAGVEYGTQCRCSNTLTTSTGGGATLAASRCSMACAGDSTAMCGGSYTMNLYYSQPLLSSISASSTSAAASPTSSAAVPTATGWSAGACVSDDNARLLTSPSTLVAQNMTAAVCQTFCSAFAYSGTQYGTQCFCGNTNIPTSGHGQPSTNCNYACAGDSTQTCGGSYALTLYTKTPAKWSTPTCVTDGGGDNRLLNAYYLEGSLMTNTLCQTTCSSKNYIYAATEYSNQCYCSNTLATSSTVGKASTGCTYKCAGNSSQICGGSYAASLSTFS